MIAPLVKRYPGLRVAGTWDPFEMCVRAILGQQVTVKAATTISGRVVERWGIRVATAKNGGPAFVFPKPKALARARLDRLGIPTTRATAIREIAKAFRDDRLRFDGSMGFEDIFEVMTSLSGIGPWTAHYVAMRAAGEPDAFPSGDLALQRAATARDESIRSEAALKKRAEAWRPWRSYATMHLWTEYTERLAVPSPAGKRRRK
jgi:3-methyladenine DNA glycosylase/8-oxoguanine DNA glycosylase